MRITSTWTGTLLKILILGLIAWIPAQAQAEEELRSASRCLAFQKDMTDPALRELLGQHLVMPAGSARSYLSSGRKISQSADSGAYQPRPSP